MKLDSQQHTIPHQDIKFFGRSKELFWFCFTISSLLFFVGSIIFFGLFTFTALGVVAN